MRRGEREGERESGRAGERERERERERKRKPNNAYTIRETCLTYSMKVDTEDLRVGRGRQRISWARSGLLSDAYISLDITHIKRDLGILYSSSISSTPGGAQTRRQQYPRD